MNHQIYGLFNSLVNAEQAIAALKDHGVAGGEISIVHRSDGTGAPIVEEKADHELTATSAEDVLSGAAKGGAAGLALGILAGAVALTVPGIGPILAAGPLWAAFGTALAATGAGMLGGGVVGLLVDQGLPADAAARYGNALTKGDLLVSVRSPKISNADTRMLLAKYGATDIEDHLIGEETVGTLDPPLTDSAADPAAVIAPPVSVVTTTSAATGGPVMATPVVSSVVSPVTTARVYPVTTTTLHPDDDDVAGPNVAAAAARSGLEPVGSSTT